MAEQPSYTPDEARFGDLYDSPHYQYGGEFRFPGDPDSPADFARAQNYLETITSHLLEFGPVWGKQPQDIVEELSYHNAWHKAEVEQEQKRDRTVEYREINLKQLYALSTRRLLAFEETGWEVTYAYKVVTHIHSLVEQALLEQAELEPLMAASVPQNAASSASANKQGEDIPF